VLWGYFRRNVSNSASSKLFKKGKMFMKIKTMSHCQGKGSLSHNNRDFLPKNVDESRIKDNITFIKEPIAEAYEKIFDAAVERYNAKQIRADRKIKNGYYEHVFNSKPRNTVVTSPDKRNSFYEDLVQIGDKDDSGCGTPDGELVAECLTEYFQGFSERNPNFYVFQANLHKDEATPHLHIDYIPVGHYKRGVDTQNGLSQALKEMGFTGINAISDWRIQERKILEEICNARGIQIKEPQKARGSFAVEEYKAYKDNINELQSQVSKETAQLETLNEQVEFSQGHYDFLEKEIDEKSVVVEQLEGKQSALESTIESDKAELEKISKKKADVKAVENIEVKNTLFGDKVTVSADDFENLKTLARKQVVSTKNTKKLKSQVEELTQENQALMVENKDLKAKSGNSIQIRLENDRLRKKVGVLQNSLDWVMKFIEKFNLEERLETFLSQFRERERENKRSHGQEL
jgi:regulator of replication initiation timing